MRTDEQSVSTPLAKPKNVKLQVTIHPPVDRALDWLAHRGMYGSSKGEVAATLLNNWFYFGQDNLVPDLKSLIDDLGDGGDGP